MATPANADRATTEIVIEKRRSNMPRYLVSIEGPEQLDPLEVKNIIDHQLPDADGYTVEAASTRGTVFASVSVFDEAMTEVARVVQQLDPSQDSVEFTQQAVLATHDGGVTMYHVRTKFTRALNEAQPAAHDLAWSPSKGRQ